MTWLPEGPVRPDPDRLNDYWQRASGELRDSGLTEDYQVRWIGLDDATTEDVIQLISAGDITGTFSLPWLIAQTRQLSPAVDDCIILIDFKGRPRLLVRLTGIHSVNFGNISAADIAIDGSPVRDLKIWIPLHTQYWNSLLNPFDMQVSDDMPVLVEKFELLHVNAAEAND